MDRVMVAMSGGVDSSVAAGLLRQQGYDVAGVYIRHGVNAESGCGSSQDEEDARKIADQFGIPFHVLDVSDQFTQITRYFVSEYLNCRTPNPCVRCNRLIKFGLLFDFAQSQGYPHLATGHYAQTYEVPCSKTGVQGKTETGLFQGIDPKKDQSYVLFGIDRHKLPFLRFPLGGLMKSEIRTIADSWQLHLAHKKDSQEICFIPDNDYTRFLRPYKINPDGTPRDTSGRFVSIDGTVLGRHDGIEKYTIGQRKGLGIALGERTFVLRLDPETHDVVLGSRDQLACDRFTISGTRWLTDLPDEFNCSVKIRYQFTPVDVTVRRIEGTGHETGDRFEIVPFEPICGVTPGQACVCYRDLRVLGGGWID